MPLLLTATLGLLLTACGGTTATGAVQGQTPTAFSGTLSALNLTAGTATVAGTTIALGQVNVTRNGVPVSAGSLSVGQQVDVTTGTMTAQAMTAQTMRAQAVNGQDSTAGSVTMDIHTELEGEVSAVDTAVGTITVAGQVITLDSATQIHLSADRDDHAGTGTLADIMTGMFVEVSVVDPASTPVIAASIEVKDERERADDDRDPKAHTSHLRGTVSGLDMQAHTFMLGDVTVDFSAVKVVGPLADGVRVNVQGSYDAAMHTMTAAHIEVNGSRKPGEHDGGVYGTVQGLDTAAHTFTLGPITVDYTAATVTGTLSAGARVEVEGTIDSATHVLTATRIEVRGDRPTDAPGQILRAEGRVTALDTAAQQFTMRGLAVAYGSATVRGALKVGAEVRVTGTLSSATASLMTATVVEVQKDD